MITLSTASLYPYGLNRIFEIAKNAGFESVELMLRSKTDNAYIDSWDHNYLLTLMKEFNISVNSVHVPFEFEDLPINFPEIVDHAKNIQAKQIIVHIPREDQTTYIDWFNINRSIDYGDPIVLFENVHLKKGKADPILSYQEIANLKSICFDIAHALRSEVEVEKIVKTLNNVVQFHVSYWDGKEDHLSILQNKDLFRRILMNTKADLCLELCPKAFDNILDTGELISKLKETKEFLDEIVA